jgi:hypothetical protein
MYATNGRPYGILNPQTLVPEGNDEDRLALMIDNTGKIAYMN